MSSPDQKPSLLTLPDDLLLICIARVSRLYYPTLSLVSKRFRSLLVSPELYKARSLLENSENCLYLCLSSHMKYSWFTLCRKPDQTLNNDTNNNKKSRSYVLATVSFLNSPHSLHTSLVAVGSNIYNIGGCKYSGEPSSRVSILDCHSHTWREGPSLPVELKTYSTSVIDQNIYVAARNKANDSFKILDTKNQTWDSMPIPSSEINRNLCYLKSACIDGKFHVKTAKEVIVYNSKESRWDLAGRETARYMLPESYCDIENVLYSCCDGVLRWYDTRRKRWRNLMGLVGLPEFPCRDMSSIRLADYGGKMAVLWIENMSFGKPGESFRKKIWCAMIALERPKRSEIWGKVEWFDHVLTVPTSYYFVKTLTSTIV